MKVVIATKRAKVASIPYLESARPFPAASDERSEEPQVARIAPKAHDDADFDSLTDEIDRGTDSYRKKREAILRGDYVDDLDKYRPPKEKDDYDWTADRDVDDYGWESNYQIGPETYLMSIKNPTLAGRVRDYRRELWGDAAPYVMGGLIGWRNQDITVRERRRYTDVLKEEPSIQRSVSALDCQLEASHRGAVRRVNSSLTVIPLTTKPRRGEGTHVKTTAGILYNVILCHLTFDTTTVSFDSLYTRDELYVG